VQVVEPLGAETIVVFTVAGHTLHARWQPDRTLKAGIWRTIAMDTANAHWFDPASRLNLRALD
jgi:ABC-type sugar transport system ATPase subunit